MLITKERYESAIERFERVQEALRWFPYNIDRQGYQKRASESIKKSRKLRNEQVAKHRAMLQQAALEQAKAQKAGALRYRNARLKSLYRRALEAYKAKVEAMLARGEISQEQADAKLRWIEQNFPSDPALPRARTVLEQARKP